MTQTTESRGRGDSHGSEGKEWDPVHASEFEPMFSDLVCTPLLPLIPRWVTPNGITMLNMAVVFAGAACSLLALEVAPGTAWALRSTVALCIFASAVLDCLDGAYARYSKQSSKFGEVLDHWVDSWNIPLTAACTSFCVCTDNLNGAVGVVAAMLTFNSQVKLYHITGKFIMPNHSGSLGQCVAAALVFATACIIYVFGRSHWFTVTLRVVAVLGFHAGQVQNLHFYYHNTRVEGAVRGMTRIFLPCFAALLVITAVFLRQNPWIDWVHGSNVLSDSLWPSDPRMWCTPLTYALIVTVISGLSSGTTVVCAVSKTPFVAETPVYFAAAAFLLAQAYSELHAGPFTKLEVVRAPPTPPPGHRCSWLARRRAQYTLLALPYFVIFACVVTAVHHFLRLKRKIVKSA